MARLFTLALALPALALGLAGAASAQQQQAAAAAGGAPIPGFRGLELGMAADAAKATLAKLGGGKVVEAGESVKVEKILRTEVGGVDGGTAKLWVDISQGKVVNISVVRQYENIDRPACKEKFEAKAKEITAQYGQFDQPNRWMDSQELYVNASRTRARISRDGKALDLVGTHAMGGGIPGQPSAGKHVVYCIVSTEISDVAWGQERRASGRI